MGRRGSLSPFLRRSALVELGRVFGGGTASLFSSAGLGAVGASGNAQAVLAFAAQGTGEIPPTGRMEHVLRLIVSANGAQLYGEGSATLRFVGDADGIVVVKGEGIASLLSATASGSVAVIVEGRANLGFSALGTDQAVRGTGVWTLRFAASGAGTAATAGQGVASLRFVGAVVGRIGVAAVGNGALKFKTTSGGTRGAIGSGAASLRFVWQGTARRGCAGNVAASLRLTGFGVGAVPLLVSGRGETPLFNAFGRGEIPVSAQPNTIHVLRRSHSITVRV